jgi:hypothetical protein
MSPAIDTGPYVRFLHGRGGAAAGDDKMTRLEELIRKVAARSSM